MKKTKKAKVAKAKKTSLFGGTKSLKKLGKGTSRRIGGLSTLQKVAGGAAIVALGLSFLGKRKGVFGGAATATPDATGAEQNLTAMDPEGTSEV